MEERLRFVARLPDGEKIAVLCRELISANFQSKEAVYAIKASLREFAEQQNIMHCRCIRLPDTAVVDMGYEEEIFN